MPLQNTVTAHRDVYGIGPQLVLPVAIPSRHKVVRETDLAEGGRRLEFRDGATISLEAIHVSDPNVSGTRVIVAIELSTAHDAASATAVVEKRAAAIARVIDDLAREVL